MIGQIAFLVVALRGSNSTHAVRRQAAPKTTLIGQFLQESWCAVPWQKADGTYPPIDPNCPCMRGTSPKYSIVDRFGTKHWIILDADQIRSLGGVSPLISQWVKVTGHPWAQDSSAVEMERLSVITPASLRRSADPLLKTWVPQNAFAADTDTNANAEFGARSSVTQVRKYVTLLVRFSDSLATTPHTPDWYTALMQTSYPGMDHFTREASYSQVGITNQTVGWINLPQPLSYYLGAEHGLDTTKIMTDAIPLIGTQVAWSGVWGVNIWSNSDDQSGVDYASFYQLTAQNQNRWIPITKEIPPWSAQSSLGHEDGHNYGNDHSSGMYNTPYDSHWDVNSSGSTWENLSGILGSMAVSVHYNAFHKAKRGWITPARIFYALPGTNRRIRLERLAQPTNSTDYLMAKVYIGGYDTRYYTVEARKYAGYDAQGGIPGEAVVIHNCDELRVVTDAYGGPRMDRASQVEDHHHTGDPNVDGMWLSGQTFSDATNGIKIAVDSEDATGFYVTVKVDPDQPSPGVLSNTGDVGGGSLREAFYYHNEFPTTTIPFHIPLSDPGYANGYFTIKLQSPLPTITQAGTLIDGTQEAKFLGVNSERPLVMLDGSGAGEYNSGLNIAAPNCTIKGLAIGNFLASGIWVAGANVTNTVIQDCEVGITPAGVAAPNQWDGITVEGAATKTKIGGSSANQGNVVSGNVNNGILFNDPASNGNTLQGNYIGTGLDGTGAVPNGTGLQLISSSNNSIGGSSSGQGNVVSGNTGNGILVGGAGSTGNLVLGNKIGTSADGTKAVPNGWGLVFYNGATANTVGGTSTGQGNLVSGNTHDGIVVTGPSMSGYKIYGNTVGTDLAGINAVPNGGWGVVIDSGVTSTTIQGNLISGNTGTGIGIGNAGTTGIKVVGNTIGLSRNGLALGNQQCGVYVYGGAKSNTIGGTTSTTRNLISANANCGVLISDPGSDGNAVEGNYVGTDGSGTKAAGNGSGIVVNAGAANTSISANVVSASTYSGIFVQNGPCTGTQILNNIVGLDVTGKAVLGNGQWGIGLSVGVSSTVTGNWVAGNGGVGIGVGDPGTKLNVIAGNTVGLTKAGVLAGNKYDGIYVHNGATQNTIGGTAAASRNVIAGNQSGITISDVGTTGNKVTGNYVGTEATGTKAMPNVYTGIGIYNGASSNVVGGSASGDGNVISGNGQNGMCVDGTNGSTGNQIMGNRIGVSVSGTPLGNKQDGISIYNGATKTLVGGPLAAANTIANNQNGVSVWDSAVDNTIRFNSIYGNSGQGIYLSGSANHGQLYPSFVTISEGSSSTAIQVQVVGSPDTNYVVDFYSVVNPGGGGYGQGDSYVGSLNMTTNASGIATATETHAFSSTTSYVSSTATSLATGDTSQFSLAWQLVTIAKASVSPTSVKGGVRVTGTVQLSAAAPTGGIVVYLKGNTSNVTTPAHVTIPAGSTSTTFTIATTPVKATSTTGFTASLGGNTVSVTLTLTP